MTATLLTEEIKTQVLNYLLENPFHYSTDEISNETIINMFKDEEDEYSELFCAIDDEIENELFETIKYKFDLNDLDTDSQISLMELIRGNMRVSFDNWLSSIKVPLQISLISNYDCVGTDVTYDFDITETYIGDCVKALNLEPQTLKMKLIEKTYINPIGRFPKKLHKLGKEVISYDGFIKEVLHISSGANLLTFIVNATLNDLIKNDYTKCEVTIPKGTLIGFLDTFNGGGSIIDTRTTKDLKIKLNDTFDKNYNAYFRLDMMHEFKWNYSNIYGTDIKDENTITF